MLACPIDTGRIRRGRLDGRGGRVGPFHVEHARSGSMRGNRRLASLLTDDQRSRPTRMNRPRFHVEPAREAGRRPRGAARPSDGNAGDRTAGRSSAGQMRRRPSCQPRGRRPGSGSGAVAVFHVEPAAPALGSTWRLSAGHCSKPRSRRARSGEIGTAHRATKQDAPTSGGMGLHGVFHVERGAAATGFHVEP